VDGKCPSSKTCSGKTCIESGTSWECKDSTFEWPANKSCPTGDNLCTSDTACGSYTSKDVFYCNSKGQCIRNAVYYKSGETPPQSSCTDNSDCCGGTNCKKCQTGYCVKYQVYNPNNSTKKQYIFKCEFKENYVKPENPCPSSGCSSDSDCDNGGGDEGECPNGTYNPHKVCNSGQCTNSSTCGTDVCSTNADCTKSCSVTATATPNPIPVGQSTTTISATNLSHTSLSKCKVSGFALPYTVTQTDDSYTYNVACTGNTGYNSCSADVTVTNTPPTTTTEPPLLSCNLF